ncbi:MAG: response regulator [Chloroflexota bacterium]
MRILYIDDDPSAIRMIGKLVGTAGYRLTGAGDVRQGIVTAMREKPDLILMDFDLPGVNGLDAVMMIKKSGSLGQTPIIMVTASATDEEAHIFLNKGADGFVPKPVSKDRLLETIKNVMNKKNNGQDSTKITGAGDKA